VFLVMLLKLCATHHSKTIITINQRCYSNIPPRTRSMQETPDFIVNARWVLPIIPENTLYQNYAVVVGTKGRLLDILPQHEAKEKYPGVKRIVNRPNHVLLPGLVNAHTHSPMTLFRGFADDLNLVDWLNTRILPAEAKWVSKEFVADGTRLAVAEMLRNGTTCFNDMYFYPEVSAEVTEKSGLRGVFGAVILKFPTMYAQTSAEYFAKGIELIEKYKHHPRIKVTIAPHAPYSVSDEQFKEVVKVATEHNVKIHIHLHETKQEIDSSVQELKMRPFERLESLGVINDKLIAVHCTQLNENEISVISRRGCSVVHCPESNCKLASGYCPVPKLVDYNVNVALGTDGTASNNDLDMFVEMRTAVLLAKLFAMDSKVADAFTILKMCTYNGAKALGLEKEIGSLEVGKQADFITINLESLETVPVYNPISHLVYCIDRNKYAKNEMSFVDFKSFSLLTIV
jgi:5-methylthioadenosine/S-adenosylhomocysteine deaminase